MTKTGCVVMQCIDESTQPLGLGSVLSLAMFSPKDGYMLPTEQRGSPPIVKN